MRRVYLIHGVRAEDAHNSSISFLVHRLKPVSPLVKMLDYGFIPAIVAPLFNWLIVRMLKQQIRPGCILVGHSNGCALAYRLSQQVKVHGLVLVNPALNHDVEFDPSLAFIQVYWSHADRITWLSRLMPFYIWGSMGTRGYTGDDPRVQQWDMGLRHTDIGDPAKAGVWRDFIAGNIKQAMKG